MAGNHSFVHNGRVNAPPQARGHSYGISRPYLQTKVSLSPCGSWQTGMPLPADALSCRFPPCSGTDFDVHDYIRLAAKGIVIRLNYSIFKVHTDCFGRNTKYICFLCFMREPVLAQKCTLFPKHLQSITKSVVFLGKSVLLQI